MAEEMKKVDEIAVSREVAEAARSPPPGVVDTQFLDNHGPDPSPQSETETER